jgi:hypothetical protein
MSRNQFLVNLHRHIDQSITINANCEVRRSRRCCLVFTFLLKSSYHCFPTCNKTVLFGANFCVFFTIPASYI